MECRSFGAGTSANMLGPRFTRSQLVDYLRSSEQSEPDVAQMKSTPLRSIQSLLVAILHDYWLAKYVMHVIAVDRPRARDDGAGDAHCLSAGTFTTLYHHVLGVWMSACCTAVLFSVSIRSGQLRVMRCGSINSCHSAAT